MKRIVIILVVILYFDHVLTRIPFFGDEVNKAITEVASITGPTVQLVPKNLDKKESGSFLDGVNALAKELALRKAQADADIKKSEEELDKSRNDKAKAIAKQLNDKKQLGNLDSELAQTGNNLDSLQNSLQITKDAIKKEETALNALQNKKIALQANIKALEDRKKNEVAEKENLRKEIDNLGDTVRNIDTDMPGTRDKLEKALSAKIGNEEAIKMIRKEIESRSSTAFNNVIEVSTPTDFPATLNRTSKQPETVVFKILCPHSQTSCSAA